MKAIIGENVSAGVGQHFISCVFWVVEVKTPLLISPVPDIELRKIGKGVTD